MNLFLSKNILAGFFPIDYHAFFSAASIAIYSYNNVDLGPGCSRSWFLPRLLIIF